MSRWIRIARSDGAPDPQVLGLVTYTITGVEGKGTRVLLWRLAPEGGQSVRVGAYDSIAEAKAAAEREQYERERKAAV